VPLKVEDKRELQSLSGGLASKVGKGSFPVPFNGPAAPQGGEGRLKKGSVRHEGVPEFFNGKRRAIFMI